MQRVRRSAMRWVRATAVLGVLGLLGVLGVATPASAACSCWNPLDVYYIGNSKTWDTLMFDQAKLSDQVGIQHTVGHHIRAARSLTYIEANPGEVTADPTVYGNWDVAIPNFRWDVVTFQTHPGSESTLSTDIAAMVSLIDRVRANPFGDATRLVLHAPWPKAETRHTDEYDEIWLATTDAADPPVTHTRQYTERLVAGVLALRPNETIEVISTGEMLYMVDQQIKAAVAEGGNWNLFTEVDFFYRDPTHLNDAGRWMAMLAMWASLTGEDPAPMQPTDYWGEYSYFNLVPEMAPALAQFVADSMDEIHYTVTYEAVLPEPGAAVLLALGSGVLLSRRRLNRRRAGGSPSRAPGSALGSAPGSAPGSARA